MLLKLYTHLNSKISQLEVRLTDELAQRAACVTNFSLFSFRIILLNQLLVLLAILADLTKYLIVLIHPHSDSFIVLFHQKELSECAFSYHRYKVIQKQVRVFSFAGLVSMVVITVLTTLVTNLIFSVGSFGNAASFGWIQTDWSTGVSTTTFPVHASNQTGWTKLYQQDSLDTTSGELKLIRD